MQLFSWSGMLVLSDLSINAFQQLSREDQGKKSAQNKLFHQQQGHYVQKTSWNSFLPRCSRLPPSPKFNQSSKFASEI